MRGNGNSGGTPSAPSQLSNPEPTPTPEPEPVPEPTPEPTPTPTPEPDEEEGGDDCCDAPYRECIGYEDSCCWYDENGNIMAVDYSCHK